MPKWLRNPNVVRVRLVTRSGEITKFYTVEPTEGRTRLSLEENMAVSQNRPLRFTMTNWRGKKIIGEALVRASDIETAVVTT